MIGVRVLGCDKTTGLIAVLGCGTGKAYQKKSAGSWGETHAKVHMDGARHISQSSLSLLAHAEEAWLLIFWKREAFLGRVNAF